MFSSEPRAHIVGHWNYPEGTVKTVYVASNGDAVELFLDGKSLGRGQQTDRFLFSFPDIAYKRGVLRAATYRRGVLVAEDERRTTGAPVALRMTPLLGPQGFQASGSDVALLDVEAVDARGDRVPTFEGRVDFELEGPAIWRGGYNSGLAASINQRRLNLEAGINRVAIRSTLAAGKVTVVAHGAGLREARVDLQTKALPLVGGMSPALPPLPRPPLPKGATPEPETVAEVARLSGAR
jgi:beta-galactosidase